MDVNDMQPILDNLNAAFAGLPVYHPADRDPGDCKAPDEVDDACGFIAWAAQMATADMPNVMVDDECRATIEGAFVTFDMPHYRVKVPRNADADLMAKWAADELYLAVAAARRETK